MYVSFVGEVVAHRHHYQWCSALLAEATKRAGLEASDDELREAARDILREKYVWEAVGWKDSLTVYQSGHILWADCPAGGWLEVALMEDDSVHIVGPAAVPPGCEVNIGLVEEE